ncbi:MULTISPECIES: DNA cytosine methyltransferase [unclassified Pseudomonas]|uniref:DNA cytosine methyltransferase n=1 Tax=unclassified Pseudomonas TaxID=196821 RepID=UPI001C497D6A|nr:MULTISPECIES: DNA cytosine methyltransferase [unclassified Pseudomonas]
MNVDVFDFFSGCGGTSCGFRDIGLNIKMAIDIDYDAIQTFKQNFPDANTIQKDIREVKTDDISHILGKRENPLLFCGCAPCQPFSKQNRQRTSSDTRSTLLDEFGRFVEAWLPEYVFVENVPGIQRRAANSKTFKNFLGLLDRLGYNHDSKVVEAQWFGVPQRRARLVLIASKKQSIYTCAKSRRQ